MVVWPANGEMAFKALDYSVSGRLQTDILWELYEYARYGEDALKTPLSELM